MSGSVRRLSGAALLAAVLMGGSYVGSKLALQDFTPMAVLALRFVVGGPLLVAAYGPELRRLKGQGHLFGLLAFAALVGVASQLIFLVGLAHTTASNSALLISTSPMWTTLLAATLGQDRLHRHTLAGVLVGFAGVMLIVGQGAEVGGSRLLGDGLTLLSALTFSAGTVALGWVVPAIGPRACTCVIGVFSVVVGVLFAFPVLAVQPWHESRPESWAGLVYTVLGAYVLFQVAWNRGIQQVGPTQAMLYSYLPPVFGILLAALLLGERLAGIQLVGGLVVVAGIALAQGRFHRATLSPAYRRR